MSLSPLHLDAAQEVAVQALIWLADDLDRMGQFLAMSGAGADDLRARIGDPVFLGFVLDFILSDDAMVIALSEVTGTPLNMPARARAALPGGDLHNWT